MLKYSAPKSKKATRMDRLFVVQPSGVSTLMGQRPVSTARWM